MCFKRLGPVLRKPLWNESANPGSALASIMNSLEILSQRPQSTAPKLPKSGASCVTPTLSSDRIVHVVSGGGVVVVVVYEKEAALILDQHSWEKYS